MTNSVSFANAGMGGTVEEEMEGFKNVAEVTLSKIQTPGTEATAKQ